MRSASRPRSGDSRGAGAAAAAGAADQTRRLVAGENGPDRVDDRQAAESGGRPGHVLMITQGEQGAEIFQLHHAQHTPYASG